MPTKLEYEHPVRARPGRAPTHPGAVLREDILPALEMDVATVAKAIGITQRRLRRITAEQTPVTPEMALRLGKFCGTGPELWMSMQVAYDLWHAQEKMSKEIRTIAAVRAAHAGRSKPGE